MGGVIYHGDTTKHYNTPNLVGWGGCSRGLQDLLTHIPRNYTPTHHSPTKYSPTHDSPMHHSPTWHTPKNHTPTHHTPHTPQFQWGGGGLAVQRKLELAPLSALGQSTPYNMATMETHKPRHTYLPAFFDWSNDRNILRTSEKDL